jgi:hypothetical protein
VYAPRRTRVRFQAFGLAAAAIALLTVTALRAQQGGGGAGGGGAQRPMIPMTAASITLQPEAHFGENVSMMAAVETVVSKTAFTVDQDNKKATGKEVLVIAPNLQTAPAPNAYVTVQGEVFKFDLSELVKRAPKYVLDIPPDMIAKFQGKPAVLATSVITAALLDIAKRQPPPMTPAETAFRKVMMTVSSNFNNVRGGLDAPNLEQLKQQTSTLKSSFADAVTFFKDVKMTEAEGLAQQALKFATAAEAAAAAGKVEDLKTAVNGIAPLCTQCHTAHRERLDDGSYRVKMGG